MKKKKAKGRLNSGKHRGQTEFATFMTAQIKTINYCLLYTQGAFKLLSLSSRQAATAIPVESREGRDSHKASIQKFQKKHKGLLMLKIVALLLMFYDRKEG